MGSGQQEAVGTAGRPGQPWTAARVSVVIPAKNEERNLPHVLAALPDGLHEVLLVDGCSTDDTVTAALRSRRGIRIVAQPGEGKGDALAAGCRAATGEIVVMLDADGSTDPAEIPRFVGALEHGADFVKGSRYLAGGGSDDLTWVRRTGNRALAGLVNLLFGTRYTDLCYGYNACWSRHVDVLRLDRDGFEIEAVMNIRAATAGLRVEEVPSFERRRLHGDGNLSVTRDGLRILRAILAERLTTRREAYEPLEVEERAPA